MYMITKFVLNLRTLLCSECILGHKKRACFSLHLNLKKKKEKKQKKLFDDLPQTFQKKK